MNLEQKISDPRKVLSFLTEIYSYLEKLHDTGESTMIFLGQTGLTDQEQVDVIEILGKGEVEISIIDTDEPVEWYETKIYGIWLGVFKDHEGGAIDRSIEVTKYPTLAQSMKEDMQRGLKKLIQVKKEYQEANQDML